jgi:protein-S-isoprenylcysteine O-methyltransferase Ste14
VILVLLRTFQLKKLGIKAIHFGEMDKKDYFIPPFVVLLFYIVLAHAFGPPKIGFEWLNSAFVAWVGVTACILGILLFIYALFSFGKSLRVGLDEEHPGELVTTGAFAISRNPLYSAFGLALTGLFLIIPNWTTLIYLIGGIWLFNRQIRLEERSLTKIYGEKYMEYSKRVRRFL